MMIRSTPTQQQQQQRIYDVYDADHTTTMSSMDEGYSMNNAPAGRENIHDWDVVTPSLDSVSPDEALDFYLKATFTSPEVLTDAKRMLQHLAIRQQVPQSSQDSTNRSVGTKTTPKESQDSTVRFKAEIENLQKANRDWKAFWDARCGDLAGRDKMISTLEVENRRLRAENAKLSSDLKSQVEATERSLCERTESLLMDAVEMGAVYERSKETGLRHVELLEIANKELSEEVDSLRAQAEMFKMDFEQEREDRTRAQAEINKLREQIERMRKPLPPLPNRAPQPLPQIPLQQQPPVETIQNNDEEIEYAQLSLRNVPEIPGPTRLYPVLQPPRPAPQEATWQCPNCTLNNEPTARRCGICDMERLDNRPPPTNPYILNN